MIKKSMPATIAVTSATPSSWAGVPKARELRDGLICPVLLGSAIRENGVLRLMKALRHEAPGVAETARRLGASAQKDALAYVFKKEILYIPFFGWGIARCDMIHIDRQQGKQAFQKVIEQGQRLLADGTWVIMFPEGTRITRGQVGQYKLGGTRLAVETGAPVVPIAVSSGKCWPRKGFIKYPGMVDVSIGKPIPSAGRAPDELMREVQEWIEGEMRRLDPEAYR